MTFVRQEHVSGRMFDLHLQGGTFVLVAEGKKVEGDNVFARSQTLDGALREAGRALRADKVKVAVPFITGKGNKGVAHGLHSRNGTILAKVEGEKWEPTRYPGAIFGPDTPTAVIARYAEIHETILALENEAHTINREHGINLLFAVRNAVKAAEEAMV